ncbi:DUF4254 domain-containing protein [Nocardia aobensis]|uniref:DUF4254 domain-containing protein n=1 Tax=Nocardia aobensis TaxID=257277 RepID=A0ABW6PCB6_9NOCA
MDPIAALPPKYQLLQACRGDIRTGHPLLHGAHRLAVLHAQRRHCDRDGADVVDRARELLIAELDHWITGRFPPAHGAASIHTETLGSVIDRLAYYTASVDAAFAEARAAELRYLWGKLGELAVAYSDLVSDIQRGVRRLPGCS